MSQSQRIAKNVAIMMGTQFLTWGFGLLTTIFVPRYFGATALGELTIAGATLAWCSLLSSLNPSMVLTKDVARDPSCIGDYIIAMLPLRISIAIMTALLACTAVNVLHYSPQTRLFVYILTVPLLWGGISDGLSGILRGQEDFARQSLSSIVEKVLGAAVTLLLIFVKAPLWMIVAGGLAPSLIGFFVVLSGFRRVAIPRPAPRHLALSRYFVVAGLPYFSAGVFATLYGAVDPIVIKWLDGYAAVGWYGLVKKLFGTALFIPVTVTAALLPQLTRMYHENRDAFASAVRRMNNLMITCAAPIAVVLIFAPQYLVKLMESRHHTDNFQGAIPIFVLFGFALILWFLSQTLGTALIASDRQVIFGKTTALACALIVPLCVPLTYLTKRFLNNGAIGAGLSDILIEVVLLAFYIRALPPGIFGRENVRQLGRIALASLPMGLIVVALVPRLGLFSILPGILAYAACGWALKVASPEDIEMLRQIVRRKTGAQQTAAALQAAEGVEAGTGPEDGLIGLARRRKTLYFARWEEQSPTIRYKMRRRAAVRLTEMARRPGDLALGKKGRSVSEGKRRRPLSQLS